MSIDLSRVTSVAIADASITEAENLKSELHFRKSATERQLSNSSGNGSSLPTRLGDAQRNLAGLNALLSGMAAGTDRDGCLRQIADLERDIDNLTNRVENYSDEAQQTRVMFIVLYQIRVDALTQYLSDLNTLRAQLVAAAA